jgi:hypothetical protein
MKKNHIPTNDEVMILRQMIKTSEKKLDELDSEIKSLQADAHNYQTQSKDLETMLRMTKRLHYKSKKSISFLESIGGDPFEDRVQLGDGTDSITNSPLNSYHEIRVINENFTDTESNLLQVALSAVEKAALKVIQAEEDIAARQRLLFCVEESISSRVCLRDEINAQTHYMKNLIGAHRQMPNELWLQIFEETVKKEEITYIHGSRTKKPPFSAMKLTWVCQKWRKLILNQPSLWCYVAILYSEDISSKQRDRIDYSLGRLGHSPPTVYTFLSNKSKVPSGIPLSGPLKQIKSFKYLDLYIDHNTCCSEDLMKELQPHVERLVLFSTPLKDLESIRSPITCSGIQNVQKMSLYHVRPRVEGVSKSINLKSLRLTQSDIDNIELIMFLRETSVDIMELELNLPFKIWGAAANVDITLQNLTTLSANLTVLVTLFNEHVILPGLQNLKILQESTMTSVDTIRHWASFITTHQRKDTISIFGISGSPLVEESEAPDLYRRIISQVANVEHLVLEGAAIIPALQGMVATKTVPSKLVKLTISKCESAPEEHIKAFSDVFRDTRRQELTIRIE